MAWTMLDRCLEPLAEGPVRDAFAGIAENAAFKVPVACGSGLAGWLIGGWDRLLEILIVLFVIDFTVGLVRAWLTSDINSVKLRRGLLKAILYAFAIVVGWQLDRTIFETGVYIPVFTRDALCVYLILSEAISIFEHLACLGVPLPAGILRRLKVCRDNIGKCGEQP